MVCQSLINMAAETSFFGVQNAVTKIAKKFLLTQRCRNLGVSLSLFYKIETYHGNVNKDILTVHMYCKNCLLGGSHGLVSRAEAEEHPQQEAQAARLLPDGLHALVLSSY